MSIFLIGEKLFLLAFCSKKGVFGYKMSNRGTNKIVYSYDLFMSKNYLV